MKTIFFLIFLLFCCSLQSQNNYQEAIKQGDEALNQRQYKTAINKYFAAEAFDPTKTDKVKAKVNKVFEKIEALRRRADRERAKAKNAEEKAKKQTELAKREASRAIKAEKEAQRQTNIAKREQAKTEKALKQVEEAQAKNQKIIDAFYFYQDRFALAYKDGNYGFIDKEGETHFKHFGNNGYAFKEALPFDNRGYAEVKMIDKIGFSRINTYLVNTEGERFLFSRKLEDTIRNRQVKEVKILDVSNQNFQNFPPELFQYSGIEILYLNNNQLRTLPDSIDLLKNLQEIHLNDNSIERLPPSLINLPNLNKLIIEFNPIKELQHNFFQLSQFQEIDSLTIKFDLEKLPSSLFEMQELWYLDISRNQLTSLDSLIVQLKNLKHLNISWNSLQSLPKNLSQLKRLEYLNFSWNLLKDLPEFTFNKPIRIDSAYHKDKIKDDLFPNQWHLLNTGQHGSWQSSAFKKGADAKVVAAWQYIQNMGSDSITIAILGSSFDLEHPDLKGEGNKIVAPWNFGTRDTNVLTDFRGTGTPVAGVALGAHNNQGILGACPNCKLMPISFTSLNQVPEAFIYSIQNGADIIICDWGTPPNFVIPDQMKAAFNYTVSEGRNGKGCAIFFAGGNVSEKKLENTKNNMNIIAMLPDVIAIAASNSKDEHSSFSGYGEAISICAPSNGTVGAGITTAYLNQIPTTKNAIRQPEQYTIKDYTDSFGGTSASVALVGGIAGLMLSVNPDLTAVEVKEILEKTADKIGDPNLYDENGHSIYFGYGRVNALEAVKMAEAYKHR